MGTQKAAKKSGSSPTNRLTAPSPAITTSAARAKTSPCFRDSRGRASSSTRKAGTQHAKRYPGSANAANSAHAVCVCDAWWRCVLERRGQWRRPGGRWRRMNGRRRAENGKKAVKQRRHRGAVQQARVCTPGLRVRRRGGSQRTHATHVLSKQTTNGLHMKEGGERHTLRSLCLFLFGFRFP